VTVIGAAYSLTECMEDGGDVDNADYDGRVAPVAAQSATNTRKLCLMHDIRKCR